MPREKSASRSYSSSLLRAGNEMNEAHTRLPFLLATDQLWAKYTWFSVARPADPWIFNCWLCPMAPSGSGVYEDSRYELTRKCFSQNGAYSWARPSPWAKVGLELRVKGRKRIGVAGSARHVEKCEERESLFDKYFPLQWVQRSLG